MFVILLMFSLYDSTLDTQVGSSFVQRYPFKFLSTLAVRKLPQVVSAVENVVLLREGILVLFFCSKRVRTQENTKG